MKPRLLFVYDMEESIVPIWRDGLWAALQVLRKDFNIQSMNLGENPGYAFDGRSLATVPKDTFLLGWGAFGSRVDKLLRDIQVVPSYKKGLCIGGNAMPPEGVEKYDVLFYETQWYREQIKSHPNSFHAFGINGDIYKLDSISRYAESYPLWNYLTVGAFASWKRQTLLCQKPGRKMAIGQIQKGNIQESIDIIGDLLLGGVGVSDMVAPEDLARFYYMADTVYIPANVIGGGERAVLEARACGRKVEVEDDNPKLKELVIGPIWEHHYYANQLKQGIISVIK